MSYPLAGLQHVGLATESIVAQGEPCTERETRVNRQHADELKTVRAVPEPGTKRLFWG